MYCLSLLLSFLAVSLYLVCWLYVIITYVMMCDYLKEVFLCL
jgi:hypothetical protein